MTALAALHLTVGGAWAADQAPNSRLPANVLTNGLVAHWKFDEHRGLTAGDSSSAGNAGALTGGTTWVDGPLGHALSFDGKSGHVQVGSPPSLDLPAKMSAFAWIRFNNVSLGGYGQCIYGQTASGGNGGQYELCVGRGKNLQEVTVLWRDVEVCVSKAKLKAGQWYHIGFTRTGHPGNWNCTIYVNGAASGVAENIAADPGPLLPFAVGRPGQYNGLYFQGAIADFRLYNRALTAAEAAALTGARTGIEPVATPGKEPTKGELMLPKVAIHVSEHTKQNWVSLSGPHKDWKYWHIYGFLMEALKSDGTPYAAVSDADIAKGLLLDAAGRPRYPMLISLAATCLPAAAATRIAEYAAAGGHVYAGATAWTCDEQGQPATAGSPQMALWQAMGLKPQQPGLISTAEKVVADPLVAHLYESGVHAWLLPKDAREPGYSHPAHWTQFVQKTGAKVLLASENRPLLTTHPHGKGRFVYHGEFAPLAGYSGYVVDNLEYGFFRKAIEAAFAANGLPLARLGAWPYPYVAALKTRHDHFLYAPAVEVEQRYGIRGEYLLRTQVAMSGPDWDRVRELIDRGALVGSHTLNELTLDTGDYKTAEANIRQSFDALEAKLGFRPSVFVAPGMFAIRDSSVQAIVANGITTTGERSHGPYPNYALKIEAEEYGEDAHWPVLEIPVSRYPARTGATWGGTYSHMESMPKEIIERTVNVTYELGGIINVYDHIGDPSPHIREVWKYPTVEHLEHYLRCATAKPRVWKTDPLALAAWWKRRDALRLEPACRVASDGTIRIVLRLQGPPDPGPFALNLVLPPNTSFIRADGQSAAAEHLLDGNRLAVKTACPGEVTVMLRRQPSTDKKR